MNRHILVKMVCSLFFVIAVLVIFSPAAQAKVTAFVAKDSSGVFYEYSYDSLLESYVQNCLGSFSPLYDDYIQRTMAMFRDDANGYIDYDAALEEYATAVIRGKGFDLDAYTSGPAAKLAEVAKVMVVTYENGQLVFTGKEIADSVEVAMHEINTASNAFSLRQILEAKAVLLSLDLSIYNNLLNSGKTAVAESLLQNRGSGYADADALKSAFAEEVSKVEISIAGVLNSLNAAASPEEFSSLLLANGDKFELELDAYRMIISSRSERVMAQVFESLPYESANTLKDIFNYAVAETLKSYVIVTNTAYNYSVSDMLDIQMPLRPKWFVSGVGWTNAPRDEVLHYVNPINFILSDLVNYVREIVISADVLFVRDAPTTEGASLATVNKGEIYAVEEVQEGLEGTAAGTEGYWFKITAGESNGWVCGKHADWVAENYSPEMLQFLALSGKSGVTVSDLALILNGKGILSGTEAVFYQASRSNNINEIFLTSLALHESGRGTSQLANGVLFTPTDSTLPPRVVYNMYGIGAVDSNPILKGAEYAYNHGWFSPEEAIIGGAYFVSRYYVNNSNYFQDTLYKMRWNPGAPGKHQYATDIGWANKQTNFIRQFYAQVNIYNLRFDIPLYQKEPEPAP
ncbi:MAG: glucosaminidase domain-containing protein [Eubacteriales bacterium]|nr:glucosaminidase domain-containing protein [Eubacteriales bacterium]MDD4079670.1 glucosaminidase domain-containing protein [Eubacteriales bacterium]MDD4769597.1 glucosaminidase domain-containing protein [Eubacteriales bacterium]